MSIAAVEAFLGGGTLPLADDIIRAALADASSPGRLQIIDREPLTILDAAHNPGGAVTLAKALQQDFGSPRAVGVISMLSDKDADGFFATVANSFERVVVTQSSSPRAVPAEELAEVAKKHIEEVSVEANVAVALEKARSFNPEAIVVAGSISLAGDVLKSIQLDDDYDETASANRGSEDGE